MVTSVIELANALYETQKKLKNNVLTSTPLLDEKHEEKALILCHICCNAYSIGLPLSVVEQLLKGTGYEQLLS